MTQELGPIQKQWIQSLRDNPQRQMKNTLGKMNGDGSYRACCLGELGLIAGICEWDSLGNLQVIKENNSHPSTSTLFGVSDRVGLRSSVGTDSDERDCLANLNDCKLTWPEIADLVEGNPGVYFTKSV